ncbi:MAG: diadenylate cyclase CdaA [Bacteroidales bacterium]
MFDFINIGIIDIIDILLVTIIIYQLFRMIRGTAAVNIFLGILLLYLSWIITRSLNMSLVSSILGQILGVGVIALIIIFQQEIRRFLLHLGGRYVVDSDAGKIARKLFYVKQQDSIPLISLEHITQACNRMSETKTGALIVLTHISPLENIIETGDKIDAAINRRLIENIFFKNTPLHDGAMIIRNNRIIAVRCTLPMNNTSEVPPQYGMRHRAAVSISEETDANAIVVSEETGNISFINNGELKTMTSISELRLTIENSYRENNE